MDAVYMTATQAMTGQGGWPMTVFMTPEREPFYCGTYFPREQFQRLVLGVANAWQPGPGQRRRAGAAGSPRPWPSSCPRAGRRDDGGGSAGAPDAAALSEITRDGGLRPGVDLRRGARRLRRRAEVPAVDGAGVSAPAPRAGPGESGDAGPARWPRRPWTRWPAAACTTSSAGGFARYSVDADWVVPHFEKMLYDNALLARVYAHWWRLTGSALARRVAAETCDWMITELGTCRGRIRRRPRRGQRRRGGQVLRLDTGPAPRRARSGRRGSTPPSAFGVTGHGHVRARHVGAPAPRRPGGPGALRPDQRGAAGRPGTAGPPGPGRQGGRRLERARHRGPGRDRPAARAARVHRGRPRRGRADRPDPPRRRPPGPDVERRDPRSQRGRAGGLRLRGRGLPGPVRRHRGSPLGALWPANCCGPRWNGSATRPAAFTTPRTTANR